jgi:hypothetical protein
VALGGGVVATLVSFWLPSSFGATSQHARDGVGELRIG